jgi:autotransporter-associated beta strand protein
MNRAGLFSAVVAAACCSLSTMAWAVDPPDLFLNHLDDFVWTGTADGTTWQNTGNWTAPPALPGEFPNDPNRIDDPAVTANITTINSVEGANFSVPRASDLTITIANTDVTVAAVKLGGITSAVTTDIVATGLGRLVFENAELNDTVTNPGDPMADPPIEPEPIYGFNQGNSLIWSTGTAGAGKENRITAPVLLNDNVDVEGDRDLHIYGTIIEGVRDRDPGDTFTESVPTSLTSLLTGGAKLYIHGDISLFEVDEDAADGTQDRPFQLNSSRGVLVPPDPQDPPDEFARWGTIDVLGHVIGDGDLHLGPMDGSKANLLPVSNIILRSDNSGFAGEIVMNRANVVLGHDNALGAGEVRTGNPPTGVGFNFISDSDTRKISIPISLAQFLSFRGANGIAGLEGIGDHSIEVASEISQSNSAGIINLLPAGKTLTLSGKIYANDEGELPPLPGRIIVFDGSGRTLITGGIHDTLDDPDESLTFIGAFRKRGSGTVVIDYNEANVNDTPTDYGGHTYVDGGNLHFATESDLPNPSSFGIPNHLGQIMSRGGAVGLDSGTTGNATFLGFLNNSSNPNATGQLPPFNVPFFLGIEGPSPLYLTYDSGGLMLAAGEYGSVGVPQSLSFEVGGNLEQAANMTLAAWETGSTFRGTITPSSTVPVNANTYQLGGGSGTLTLPDNNQLTGARSLLVTNGGEVKLNGTHSYTGKTRVTGKYLPTREHAAAADAGDAGGDADVYTPTTLTVSSLANAGTDSGIGNFASSSDATGLMIQGSSLKYVGGATSTNRLFTVGTRGATIDASGSGAVAFSNTAALGIDVAEDRTGVVSLSVAGFENNEVFGIPLCATAICGGQPVIFSTEDLVPGMRVQDVNATPQLEDDLVITSVPTPHLIQVGEDTLDEGETPWGGVSNTFVRTFTFGPAPARFLTLSGSNTGNNTLAPLVANASDIGEATADEVTDGYGSVGIQKTGPGKWILTGNNTYTGATNVEAGTLLVNGNQTGSGLTTVSSGATLGGTGQIGGGLTMLAGSNFVTSFAGGTIDPLNVVGDVDLSALANALNVTGTGVGTSWTFLTYSGMLTGAFESVTSGYAVDDTVAGQLRLITSVVTVLIGDYNNDHVVNAADYTVWRNNLGAAGGALGANRDPANGSGVVSQLDYQSWKNHFGETMPGSGGLAGGTVPEPASIVLLGLAMIGAVSWRRRG